MSEFFRRLNEAQSAGELPEWDADGDIKYRTRLGEITFHTDDEIEAATINRVGGVTGYDDKMKLFADTIVDRIGNSRLKVDRWSEEILVSRRDGMQTDIKLVAPNGMSAVITIIYDKNGMTFDMNQFGQNPMSRYADLEGFAQDQKQNFDAAIEDAIAALQGDLEDIQSFRVLWPRFGHAPYYGK
jgi:hypothetical protein